MFRAMFRGIVDFAVRVEHLSLIPSPRISMHTRTGRYGLAERLDFLTTTLKVFLGEFFLSFNCLEKLGT